MARRCSFCGQDQKGLERLVAARGGVAICGDCARLAVELSSERDELTSGDLLLSRIGTLVTNDSRHGGLLGAIEGAAVAIRQGRVTWLGRQRALPDRYRDLPEIDCDGRMVAPAFIDAHRHLSAPADGGDIGDLTERIAHQLATNLEQGATTIELRTWGVAGPEEEVTLLSAIGVAGENLPAEVVSSVTIGSEPPRRGNGYLDMVERVVIPTVAGLARFLDVVLGGPVDIAEGHRMVDVGRRHGLEIRVHGDSDDSADLAIATGAVSIDGAWNLEVAGPALAEAGVMVVSLPAASWISGRPDPARDMWDSGVAVAIGTGCRDGVVPTVPMAMAASVHHGGLSADETLWAATRGGALALQEPAKGLIAAGSLADLIVLDAEAAPDLVAEPGRDPVVHVIKDGALLAP